MQSLVLSQQNNGGGVNPAELMVNTNKNTLQNQHNNVTHNRVMNLRNNPHYVNQLQMQIQTHTPPRNHYTHNMQQHTPLQTSRQSSHNSSPNKTQRLRQRQAQMQTHSTQQQGQSQTVNNPNSSVHIHNNNGNNHNIT